MTEYLTDRQSRAARLVWYALLAMLVIGAVVLAFYGLASPVHAATVTISDIGNSTGYGLHSVTYAGSNLTATIIQGNNSSWQIQVLGVGL